MTSVEVAVALNVARRAQKSSPDPLKKVGLAIMSPMGTMICMGFNHTKDLVPPPFDGDRASERRPYPIHAEIDAITKMGTWRGTKNKIVVTTLFPCSHCMTALAAIDVTKVYYLEIYDKDKDALDIAKFYGITCEQILE